jgi:hypothetical protein
MRRLRILTWHVHGNYLYYLSLGGHDLYLPVRPGRPSGYAGRAGSFPWPHTVHEVPAEAVRDLPLDVILFQSAPHWLEDQHELLSDAQRRLPRIYLEHDPPREHPTDTRHWVDDPELLLVHVTPFNRLMWDSGRTPTRVIDHGVPEPSVRYTGELPRGLAVVNNLASRGRRLGRDVFEQVASEAPIDLVGMGAEELGGLGEGPMPELPSFAARYRFFFNPIRYTSMGLAVCEAMMLGMPVIGLATTEMAAAIENGVSGFVETDVERLAPHVHRLLEDPAEARRLGDGARRRALERFGLERFLDDWDDALAAVTGLPAVGGQTWRRPVSLQEATGP